MTTNHPTPEPLDEKALREIECRDEFVSLLPLGAEKRIPLTTTERDALCQALRVAWAENQRLKDQLASAEEEIAILEDRPDERGIR